MSLDLLNLRSLQLPLTPKLRHTHCLHPSFPAPLLSSCRFAAKGREGKGRKGSASGEARKELRGSKEANYIVAQGHWLTLIPNLSTPPSPCCCCCCCWSSSSSSLPSFINFLLSCWCGGHSQAVVKYCMFFSLEEIYLWSSHCLSWSYTLRVRLPLFFEIATLGTDPLCWKLLYMLCMLSWRRALHSRLTLYERERLKILGTDFLGSGVTPVAIAILVLHLLLL